MEEKHQDNIGIPFQNIKLPEFEKLGWETHNPTEVYDRFQLDYSRGVWQTGIQVLETPNYEWAKRPGWPVLKKSAGNKPLRGLTMKSQKNLFAEYIQNHYEREAIRTSFRLEHEIQLIKKMNSSKNQKEVLKKREVSFAKFQSLLKNPGNFRHYDQKFEEVKDSKMKMGSQHDLTVISMNMLALGLSGRSMGTKTSYYENTGMMKFTVCCPNKLCTTANKPRKDQKVDDHVMEMNVNVRKEGVSGLSLIFYQAGKDHSKMERI